MSGRNLCGLCGGLFSGVNFVLFCTLMFRVIREGGGGCTIAWIFWSGPASFQSPIPLFRPQLCFAWRPARCLA